MIKLTDKDFKITAVNIFKNHNDKKIMYKLNKKFNLILILKFNLNFNFYN